MLRLHIVIKLFVFLFAGLMISNCVPKDTPRTKKDTSFYPVLRSEDFPKEIARLEKVTRDHADSSVRTKAHLQLALLYSHYRNPIPDYSRALEELETYISLDPDGGKTDEIQNWVAVLRELGEGVKENKDMKRSIKLLIKENQKMKGSIKLLTEENQKTKESIELLTEENQKMKETIEELKYLDLQLEEKRRDIK